MFLSCLVVPDFCAVEIHFTSCSLFFLLMLYLPVTAALLWKAWLCHSRTGWRNGRRQPISWTKTMPKVSNQDTQTINTRLWALYIGRESIHVWFCLSSLRIQTVSSGNQKEIDRYHQAPEKSKKRWDITKSLFIYMFVGKVSLLTQLYWTLRDGIFLLGCWSLACINGSCGPVWTGAI